MSEHTPCRPAAPRTDPRDVRGGSPVGVALSGTEKALIDQIRQRRGLGEGRSTLLRAVILDWLEREAGYVDTARRPAAKVERKREKGEKP